METMLSAMAHTTVRGMSISAACLSLQEEPHTTHLFLFHHPHTTPFFPQWLYQRQLRLPTPLASRPKKVFSEVGAYKDIGNEPTYDAMNEPAGTKAHHAAKLLLFPVPTQPRCLPVFSTSTTSQLRTKRRSTHLSPHTRTTSKSM